MKKNIFTSVIVFYLFSSITVLADEIIITEAPPIYFNEETYQKPAINEISDIPTILPYSDESEIYDEEESKELYDESIYINSGPGIYLSENKINDTSYSQDDNISELRKNIVQYALQFKGNPYVYGGTSLTDGVDCSGFIMKIFEHFNINIPRDSRSQAQASRKINDNELKPGDLIFYDKNGTINHVALYIGNGQVIHAAGSDTGIIISQYNYRNPFLIGRVVNQ